MAFDLRRIRDRRRKTLARVDQQVLNFNTWGNMRAAKKGRESTVERNFATRADIALEAYRLFYELLKSEKLAHVANENLTLTRDQLLRTQALFELGSVAKGDVLKQQVQVSQAQLDEIRERRSVLIARARLANLLGLDPAQPHRLHRTSCATARSSKGNTRSPMVCVVS